MLQPSGRRASAGYRGLGLWLCALLVAVSGCAGNIDPEIDQFADWLRVGEGSVVADIGAGDGEYAIGLERRVGSSGRVYATELEAEDREAIAEAAREAGADRLEVREAQIDGTGLEAGSCDGIFLRRVYHHLTDPEAFTRSLFESLRPGGRLAVVDFQPIALLAPWTPEGIPEDRGGHGIDPAIIVRELEAAGFIHLETRDPWMPGGFMSNDFALLFEKPESGAVAR